MAQSELIKALQKAALYPHPIKKFQVIETHISWVVLTGFYAYKIKKPINLGFADFSTLKKRKQFCSEEFELNQPLASILYDSIIPIFGTSSDPHFEPAGTPIEYAIKMKEFPQEDKFDVRCEQKQLTLIDLEAVATQIAEFHQNTSLASKDSLYGTPEQIHRDMMDNFVEGLKLAPEWSSEWRSLQTKSENSFKTLKSLLSKRNTQGFIRDCHGDLHLGNIAQVNNSPIIFDRIEFNPTFRIIDVINEIAFLVMDLEHRGEIPLAYHFLNVYLAKTGDYEGLALLHFYKIYRALVRAKVALFSENRLKAQKLLTYASQVDNSPTPMLIIMSGISGSGKTQLAKDLAAHFPAIHLRTDLERKRLFKNDLNLYTPEKLKATYDRLYFLAQFLLSLGYSVIVDATFLKRKAREDFHTLALDLQIPFLIIQATVSWNILQSRLKTRSKLMSGSDADLAIAERQLSTQEKLDDEELQYTITVNTEAPWDINQILNKLAIKHN